MFKTKITIGLTIVACAVLLVLAWVILSRSPAFDANDAIRITKLYACDVASSGQYPRMLKEGSCEVSSWPDATGSTLGHYSRGSGIPYTPGPNGEQYVAPEEPVTLESSAMFNRFTDAWDVTFSATFDNNLGSKWYYKVESNRHVIFMGENRDYLPETAE
jgi:hypothetical protein